MQKTYFVRAHLNYFALAPERKANAFSWIDSNLRLSGVFWPSLLQPGSPLKVLSGDYWKFPYLEGAHKVTEEWQHLRYLGSLWACLLIGKAFSKRNRWTSLVNITLWDTVSSGDVFWRMALVSRISICVFILTILLGLWWSSIRKETPYLWLKMIVKEAKHWTGNRMFEYWNFFHRSSSGCDGICLTKAGLSHL